MGDEQLADWTEDDERFWNDIVAPGGVWDIEQVKRELHDYRVVMHEVGLVYDSVTWGRIGDWEPLPECPMEGCSYSEPHYHRDTLDGEEVVRLPALKETDNEG